MSYLGRLVSKTVINGKNKVHYLQTTENCCKKEETIMKKKYLKIVGFTLLVAGVAISINLGVCQTTNWSVLMKENVEALTSSETENPYYPCVPALGFCFINGIQISKVAIID